MVLWRHPSRDVQQGLDRHIWRIEGEREILRLATHISWLEIEVLGLSVSEAMDMDVTV